MKRDISSSVRRVDAVDKAGGYARYLADLSFDGLLYARLVRAEISRGSIVSMKIPPLPEGCWFISAKDIPAGGRNVIHMIEEDWPVFADTEVLFYGQTIGLVAGTDKEQVLRVLERIEIEYEEMEAAFTIDEGLALKGGPVHGSDNLYADYHLQKGNADKALAEADRIVEDEISTGFQEHVYMEPQSMVGYLENGKPAITASCQCPFYLRKAVAPVLAMQPEDIVVRQAVTGGAFGGKEHFPDVIAAPLMVAVNKIQKPIQAVFDRKEDISFTAKRHPSRVRFRTALDSAGNILGMDIDAAINAGAYESCSPIVLQRVIFSLTSVYDIDNVRIHGRAVATNTFPSDAFRGFGAPQGIFAAEMHMSHLAMETGIDEADLKNRYFIQKGGLTVTNGRIHGEVKLPEMWQVLAEKSDYYRKKPDRGKNQLAAVGTSFYLHGGGFTGNGEQEIIHAHVRIRKNEDGTAEILLSNVEMGQGLQTTFRKIAAQVLELPLEKIIYENPDTSRVPDSGPTVASRSIVVVGKLVERAAEQLKKVWDKPGVQEAETAYVHPEGFVWNQETLQGDAYPSYSWGICAVEVSVDPYTYEVETKHIWTVHDIGKAIDENIVQGQVNGGVIQALGYGGLEKMELSGGTFSQNTLADYIIPTAADFPSMDSTLVENPYSYGPFGAKEHFPDVIAAPLMVAVNKIQKPIQAVFDRKEDISFTAKRHPSRVRFRTALDSAGNILGMDIDAAINAGAYESCSPIVLQRVIFSLTSVYDIDNVRIHGRAVATNTFPSDAFRGFGAPQGIFAAEMHMSHLAMETGIDEADLKNRYFIQKGGLTVTNGRIHGEVKLPEMWQVLAEKSDYYRKKPDRGKNQLAAVGTSFYLHGGGFTGNGEQEIIHAHVRIRKNEDGTAEILLSNVEMGQGLQTTFRKIAAQVLELPLEKIIYENPDTSRVPDSGPTVASRSIVVVGKLVERAAEQLKKVWDKPGVQEAETAYVHPEGFVWNQETLQGDAYPSYSWGICAVEVSVDPYTYEVETKHIWTVHDIGKAIDENIVQGQVNGGVIQALGYGGLEKMELSGGTFSQNTLADYIIPTAADFPSMDSTLVENPYSYGPFGAKGLGELVFDGAAAAYADAVERAIGKKVNRIPVTPEYIMELMSDE